jgi:hypothetical protein
MIVPAGRPAHTRRRPHPQRHCWTSQQWHPAVLRGEKLATNDLQFFKRAKDLGLNVEFVGSGDAATNAANYVPRPVSY